MQDKIASETFKNGYNCAQSIVSTFAPAEGISRELSLKLATGLGAGVNYNGSLCGAVLGAFIVLGLHYGVDSPDDAPGKERYKELADMFTSEFLKKYESIKCREILNADVSIPEELEMLREKGSFSNVCPKVVKTAAGILEKIMEKVEV